MFAIGIHYARYTDCRKAPQGSIRSITLYTCRPRHRACTRHVRGPRCYDFPSLTPTPQTTAARARHSRPRKGLARWQTQQTIGTHQWRRASAGKKQTRVMSCVQIHIPNLGTDQANHACGIYDSKSVYPRSPCFLGLKPLTCAPLHFYTSNPCILYLYTSNLSTPPPKGINLEPSDRVL